MKKWYQSKTIWYAIVTAIAGLLTAFATAYPDIAFLSVLNSAIVLVLRFVSTTPLTPTDSQ